MYFFYAIKELRFGSRYTLIHSQITGNIQREKAAIFFIHTVTQDRGPVATCAQIAFLPHFSQLCVSCRHTDSHAAGNHGLADVSHDL